MSLFTWTIVDGETRGSVCAGPILASAVSTNLLNPLGDPHGHLLPAEKGAASERAQEL
jgi:hypothetical protein